MGEVKHVVKSLEKKGALVVELPARLPVYSEPSPPLPENLQRYLTGQGIRLYSHQVELLKKVRAGKNVVLTTSTASGKTLAFTLPVAEQLMENPFATALMIYPMKALSYDQLKGLVDLEQAALELNPAVYDGDTPRSLRKEIRETSRAIITNPHALHYYLPWHPMWKRFFSNLEFVVLDEAHWYRGIFGTNVAFLLRRLFRILDHYGAHPRLIVSSATMADPVSHAGNLTGQPFEPVNRDGSEKGKKHFVFWDANQGGERSQHSQTAELAAACIDQGLQTLCFTVSRKMAELTAVWAGDMTRGEVVPYRAGYAPEERRRIERRFKEGELAGITSTNALELGVNIGGLDAVVIGGYPGTVSSFHQRAGRAGRSGQESLVVQVLYDNPLDAHISARPRYLFEEPSEQAVISLGNKRILEGHVLCAGEELPLKREDEQWFGPHLVPLVKSLVARKMLRPAPGFFPGVKAPVRPRYVYPGKGAGFKVKLSSIGDDHWKLICDGEVLEDLAPRQACTEAHPGAVYLHKARRYRVAGVDRDSRTVELVPYNQDTYTTPLIDKETAVKTILDTRENKRYGIYYGDVRVTETVYGYALKTPREVLFKKELSSPLAVTLDTRAAWVVLKKGAPGLGALHAAEHVLIGVTPLLAMCDRWDVGGLARQGEIYIYEGCEGGVGIAERLYQEFELLVEKALDVLLNCRCDDGCPRCVMSPKCGNGNEPLDKAGAVRFLKLLL